MGVEHGLPSERRSMSQHAYGDAEDERRFWNHIHLGNLAYLAGHRDLPWEEIGKTLVAGDIGPLVEKLRVGYENIFHPFDCNADCPKCAEAAEKWKIEQMIGGH